LGNYVVNDEPRFYWKQAGKKQSNKNWVAGGDMVRTMVKIGRFDLKNLFTIFLRTSDVAYVSYLDKAKTKDHQT
jgi:hypothetical protein